MSLDKNRLCSIVCDFLNMRRLSENSDQPETVAVIYSPKALVVCNDILCGTTVTSCYSRVTQKMLPRKCSQMVPKKVPLRGFRATILSSEQP